MMIHWHEGLFLLPQHFQGLQRFVLDRIGAERPLVHRFGHGILELELNVLRESVAVKRLKAVMPSGVLLEYPLNVEIPSLDISAEMARSRSGFKVSLGVPLWSEQRANTFRMGEEPNPRVKLRYRLHQAEVVDENEGGEAKQVYLRKYNARLVLESEDVSDMEVLPLARIEPSTGNQLPRLDEAFAPPLLRLKGWPPLSDLIERLVIDIDRARAGLLRQLQEGTFNIESLHGNQLALLLRLRTINHFLPRLKALIEADQAAPFEIYCELSAMAGELMALDPVNDSLKSEGFSHDAPYGQLSELEQRVRRYLEQAPTAAYHRVDLNKTGDGYWMGEFDREMLKSLTDLYLCVESSDHRDKVSQLVSHADRFKLTCLSRINRRTRGLPLKQVNAPRGLPAQQDLHYFRVELHQEEKLWDAVLEEGKIGVAWPPAERTKVSTVSLFIITGNV